MSLSEEGEGVWGGSSERLGKGDPRGPQERKRGKRSYAEGRNEREGRLGTVFGHAMVNPAIVREN